MFSTILPTNGVLFHCYVLSINDDDDDEKMAIAMHCNLKAARHRASFGQICTEHRMETLPAASGQNNIFLKSSFD